MLHSFYNTHVETFEMIEVTIKKSVSVAIEECLICTAALLENI